MKRLLLVLTALFVMAGVAMANQAGIITCSCNGAIAIAISTANTGNNWNDATATFALGGGLATGASCVLSPFYVWNTSLQASSVIETVSLATSGTGSTGNVWTYVTGTLPAATSAGADSCAVAGLFKSVQPVFTDYASKDLLTSSPVKWATAGGAFNPASGAYSKAYLAPSVAGNPASTGGNAALFICIVTPSAVSSNAAATITINVTMAQGLI